MKTTIEINDDSVVIYRNGNQVAWFYTDKPHDYALKVIEELKREQSDVA